MKILEAQIKGGKVFVDDVEVSNVTVLCEGKSDSSGFFLIDKDKYFYITKTTQDLTSALDLIVSLADTISNGAWTGSGAIAASPALKAQLEQLKTQLNQLKQKQA